MKKTDIQEMVKKSRSYRLISAMATAMDKFFIDPIIGLIPGVGDVVGSVFAFPFIYVSLFKVRSIPLTLAVIYYNLLDVLFGMLPFWVGNLIDFFYRANLRNFRLIQGFVERDEEIIREVNRKATYMAVMIVVLAALIVVTLWLLVKLAAWLGSRWV